MYLPKSFFRGWRPAVAALGIAMLPQPGTAQFLNSPPVLDLIETIGGAISGTPNPALPRPAIPLPEIGKPGLPEVKLPDLDLDALLKEIDLFGEGQSSGRIASGPVGAISEGTGANIQCLTGQGAGEAVFFTTCETPCAKGGSACLNQRWFWTIAENYDSLVLRSYMLIPPPPRTMLRNAAAPHLCLTRTEAGNTAILRACAAFKRQTWSRGITGNRLIVQNNCLRNDNGMASVASCLSPAGIKMDIGAKGIVKAADLAVAGADMDAETSALSREDGAPHPFYVYAQCAGDDTCYSKLKLPEFFYGNHTGNGHGDGGSEPLDLGNTYSIDRCSQAHDRAYWGEVGTNDASSNDANFRRCLRSVLPATREETRALIAINDITFFAFSAFLADKECIGGKPGGLPPRDGRLDYCHCRKIAATADPDFADNIKETLDELIDGLSDDFRCDAACRVATGDRCLDDNGNRMSRAPSIVVGGGTTTPPDDTPEPRVLVRGDWVWRLAEQAGSSDIPAFVRAFEGLNPGVDADKVYVGRTYLLPPP